MDAADQNPNIDPPPLSARNLQEFPTTNWSVVVAAGADGNARGAAALEKLCARYWKPIYASVRRRGTSPHEAEDLTQSFFGHLLERKTISKADADKGRFRSFLLGSLNFYLSNERSKQETEKRGGNYPHISLDLIQAEEFYSHEPFHALSPDKLFERQWAWTLVENTTSRLRLEYEKKGDRLLFQTLEHSLVGELSTTAYDEWALALGLSEGAVRVALHRMRRRFGEILKSEVAHTVTHPEEVEEEIRQIFTAIALVQ